MTTIDSKICSQLKEMVDLSMKKLPTGISSSNLVNLAFKITNRPKASQEYQFQVTQGTDHRGKSFAAPTTFIDLSEDSINRESIKMHLPSKSHRLIQSSERLSCSRERLMAENEFLKLVRVTETFDTYDTLSCNSQLVADLDQFFRLMT